MGVAVDAASRGFKTVLLEQADFAKGTSSRSTKLIHGGVRYLGQGDIKMEQPELGKRLHAAFPHIQAEVVWAVRYEMTRRVEDVLARRLRILFLNARVALEMAPEVA